MTAETSSEDKQEARWESRIQAEVLLRRWEEWEVREKEEELALRAVQDIRMWVIRQAFGFGFFLTF